MKNDITFKKNLVKLASNFSRLIEEKKWVLKYEADLDALAIVPKKLPNDARLNYVNKEFAVYLCNDKSIAGMYIEYFRKNYLNHNSKLKGKLSEDFGSVKFQEDDLVEIKQKDTKTLIPELENELQKYLAQSIKFTSFK
jgi:hypothetical protein